MEIRSWLLWRARRRGQRGYAALLVALLSAVVFLPLCAIGVDVARWHVDIEKVQKAADAAALAGVRFMPGDPAAATAKAKKIAALNGFTNVCVYYVGATATASCPATDSLERTSQLMVTVTATAQNQFGASFGIGSTTVSRSSIADYTAPAPMGSPCNTFGNEPPSNAGANGNAPAQPVSPTHSYSSEQICKTPNFWGGVVGPKNDKRRGDRFHSNTCSTGYQWVSGCKSGVTTNPEYRSTGYYFMVHVEPAAAGQPISIQIYDPAYLRTGNSCELGLTSGLTNNMNDYAPDAVNRYGQWKTESSSSGTVTNANTAQYCAGDNSPDGSITTPESYSPITTTWVLRGPDDNDDPLGGEVICAKQFKGSHTAPTANNLKKTSTSYDKQYAQVFHQWYELCSISAPVAGNYYLQVRTNLSIKGTAQSNTNSRPAIIYDCTGSCLSAVNVKTGDVSDTGGQNAFALRAVPSSTSNYGNVAISGLDSMPMLQLGQSSAEFALIRSLPNTAGQYIAFDFFDVGDANPACGTSGQVCTVTVTPPPDATGISSPIANCQYSRYASSSSAADSGTAAGCAVTVTSANNDGVQARMLVPIPSNYSCGGTPLKLTDCWFRVKITFTKPGVTDFTTWSANIAGSPVRLVK